MSMCACVCVRVYVGVYACVHASVCVYAFVYASLCMRACVCDTYIHPLLEPLAEVELLLCV